MSQGEAEDRPTRRARFEALAVPLMKLLYNAAFRLSRDPHGSEDIVQETFLRAYRTFDSFREGTNARAWLLTILYSVFVNRYHRSKREPLTLEPEALEAAETRAALGETGPFQPDRRVLGKDVEAALGRLPDAFRATVILVDLHDLTYEQAASALGCKVGTVRSRLFRARQFLSNELLDAARALGYVRDGETRGRT